jgi:hypothetical protein
MNSFIDVYFDVIIKELFKSFPECGLLTLAGMLGAYDQNRNSDTFYYKLILKNAEE